MKGLNDINVYKKLKCKNGHTWITVLRRKLFPKGGFKVWTVGSRKCPICNNYAKWKIPIGKGTIFISREEEV